MSQWRFKSDPRPREGLTKVFRLMWLPGWSRSTPIPKVLNAQAAFRMLRRVGIDALEWNR